MDASETTSAVKNTESPVVDVGYTWMRNIRSREQVRADDFLRKRRKELITTHVKTISFCEFEIIHVYLYVSSMNTWARLVDII